MFNEFTDGTWDKYCDEFESDLEKERQERSDKEYREYLLRGGEGSCNSENISEDTPENIFSTNLLQQNASQSGGTQKAVGNRFEAFIGEKYEKEGWAVIYCGFQFGFRDNGVDLIAIKRNLIVFIQCKYWNDDLSSELITNFKYACERYRQNFESTFYFKGKLYQEIYGHLHPSMIIWTKNSQPDSFRKLAEDAGVKIEESHESLSGYDYNHDDPKYQEVLLGDLDPYQYAAMQVFDAIDDRIVMNGIINHLAYIENSMLPTMQDHLQKEINQEQQRTKEIANKLSLMELENTRKIQSLSLVEYKNTRKIQSITTDLSDEKNRIYNKIFELKCEKDSLARSLSSVKKILISSIIAAVILIVAILSNINS